MEGLQLSKLGSRPWGGQAGQEVPPAYPAAWLALWRMVAGSWWAKVWPGCTGTTFPDQKLTLGYCSEPVSNQAAGRGAPTPTSSHPSSVLGISSSSFVGHQADVGASWLEPLRQGTREQNPGFVLDGLGWLRAGLGGLASRQKELMGSAALPSPSRDQ